jgi:tRNA1Val (adenine37-N6)-methyltransferase
VLLADFAAPKPFDRVADLGAGGGILSILMADAEPQARFDAVELQPEMCDMARRSVWGNGLEGGFLCTRSTARRAPGVGARGVLVVVSNPPYHPRGTAPASPDPAHHLARHGGRPRWRTSQPAPRRF